MSTLVITSQWRNAGDSVDARVDHLFAKQSEFFDNIEYLWVVGDCEDDTLRRLLYRSRLGKRSVTIIDTTTGVMGEDLVARRARLSRSGNEMFGSIPARASHVLLHESDLQTSVNVADELYRTNSHCVVGGWPTIELRRGVPQFYDIYAYRHLDGRNFTPDEPRRIKPLLVRSLGSVFLAPANLILGRVMDETCIVSVCEQWYREGVPMIVNPLVSVIQPVELWDEP